MGLILEVYRSPLGDCTNGGISGRHTQLVAVNIPGPFEPGKNGPPVIIEKHQPGCLRIVPAYMSPAQGYWVPVPHHSSMGGNYAATSDSRFSRVCEHLLGRPFYGAVAIHDRYE